MHWTEKRRGKTALADELRRRGWQLFGYKEDRSDAMTDTYDPASWDGIAEKDGYVTVVDVTRSNRLVLSRSGGYHTQHRVPGEPCPHCQGSGKEPGGWTYERAKADPVEFNRSCTRGGVALLPHVVSPLMFDGDGDQKCTECHGAGHGWKLEPVTEPWPTYQANPPSRLWHVEKGVVLAVTLPITLPGWQGYACSGHFGALHEAADRDPSLPAQLPNCFVPRVLHFEFPERLRPAQKSRDPTSAGKDALVMNAENRLPHLSAQPLHPFPMTCCHVGFVPRRDRAAQFGEMPVQVGSAVVEPPPDLAHRGRWVFFTRQNLL